MNILYLGSFFPESRKEEILSNSKGVIQNAGNTYQNAILAGLTECLKSFKIVTSPMIGSYPFHYKSIFFKNSSFEYNSIENCICSAFINLSLYKIISRYYFVKKHLKYWAEKNSGDKYIIIFSLDLSLLKSAYEIKKKYPEIKICLIVTDLFKYMIVPENVILKSAMQYFEKKSLKFIEKVDSFVLLTEYMKIDLKVGVRPYIIIEGIYNNNNNTTTHLIYEKEAYKTILYSGTLSKQYGIIHLLDAFSKIENGNYRLWICGEGDSKEEIIKRSKKDFRIKYMGQLKHEDVIILQKKATVLINPRFSNSEFTLYSFPSKTMEYLASGTPTIMHPLKCLPKEYLKFLFIASDETDLGLMKTIIDVCETNQKELTAFGQTASNFILHEKNSKIQVGKILKLINYNE